MSYEPLHPHLRVLAWPLAAIAKIKGRGWAVTEVMRQIARAAAADGTAFGADDYSTQGDAPITGFASAYRGAVLGAMRNLQYVESHDPVDGTGFAGYQVTPQDVPRNSVVLTSAGAPDDVAVPTPRYRCVAWRPENTPFQYFSTCRQDEAEHTGLAWQSSEPDRRFSIRTSYDLPQGQSFALKVRVWSPAATKKVLDPPWFCVSWANRTWEVMVRPKSAPVLGTYRPGGVQVLREFGQGAQGGWYEGEVVWIRAEYIAGRLRVTMDGPGGIREVLYSQRKMVRGERAQLLDPVESLEGPGAPLRIWGQGCSVVADLYETMHNRYNPATQTWDMTGGFEREYWAPVSPLYASGSYPASPVKCLAMGYPATGAPAAGTGDLPLIGLNVATLTDAIVSGQLRKYTLQLTSQHRFVNEDPITTGQQAATPAQFAAATAAMSSAAPATGPLGWVRILVDPARPTTLWDKLYHANWHASRSPLLQAVSLSYNSSYQSVAAAGAIDLRAAIEDADTTTCDPGISPVRSFSCRVNHDLLPKCRAYNSGGVDIGEIGDDWHDYVGKHKPITVYAGWQDDETYGWGTNTWAQVMATGAYLKELLMFGGYQTEWNPRAEEYGANVGSIRATCPLMRLTKPAGLVDERYAPLDVLLAEKCKAGAHWDSLKGIDAIEYILQQTLGPTDINYYPYPSTWHGLMSYELLTSPPQGPKFFFPPPFGSDALSWIRQICSKDFSVFFYDRDYNAGTGAWTWIPHYGNYWFFVANGATYSVADAVHVAPWTPIYGLGEIAPHERGEHDINRTVVWAPQPGAPDTGGLFPVFPNYMGESVLHTSSVAGQGVDDSWERTHVVRGGGIWWPWVPQAVAYCIMLFLRNTRMRSVTMRFPRGQVGMNWGDRITVDAAHVQSDSTVEVTGQTFRAARISHSWKFGSTPSYTTTADCLPMPEVASIPAEYQGGTYSKLNGWTPLP